MAEVKGGHLARSAAMLCQDEAFRLYLDRAQAHKSGIDIPDGTHTVDDARDLILDACGINSRAELDHNVGAATRFRQIKNHFQRWQGRQARRGAPTQ
ncbi:hypothetical protein [Marinobacter sp. X15-166B]|uniref:hypothetical protein n=1 Tax=Marinobacter sp. X15-166B TaxID=1897620 RepID=UPI00085C2E52|nr:hypothetical protein [Marinobacter sp. X15-166B]OEY67433.1 hypothetical protein BG841_14000 [Marinobacter sp. X15-166B]